MRQQFIRVVGCRFFAINTVIVYLYYSSFQRVDEEEYGGISELLKEGLMTSFSTFLVSELLLPTEEFYNLGGHKSSRSCLYHASNGLSLDKDDSCSTTQLFS